MAEVCASLALAAIPTYNQSRKWKDLRLDARTEAVAQEVKAALVRAYGDRLAAVYAFGSRARGDFHGESDLDLAVVFRNPPTH